MPITIKANKTIITKQVCISVGDGGLVLLASETSIEDCIKGGTVNPYYGDEGPIIIKLINNLLRGALLRV